MIFLQILGFKGVNCQVKISATPKFYIECGFSYYFICQLYYTYINCIYLHKNAPLNCIERMCKYKLCTCEEITPFQ